MHYSSISELKGITWRERTGFLRWFCSVVWTGPAAVWSLLRTGSCPSVYAAAQWLGHGPPHASHGSHSNECLDVWWLRKQKNHNTVHVHESLLLIKIIRKQLQYIQSITAQVRLLIHFIKIWKTFRKNINFCFRKDHHTTIHVIVNGHVPLILSSKWSNIYYVH